MKKDAESRHESLRRLLSVAKEKRKIEGPAALAAALGESEQTVTNWGRRGVSKAGAMKAQTAFGCSGNWVLTGAEPRLIQGQSHETQGASAVSEPSPSYTVITTAQAIRTLGQALLTMEPELRDQAAVLLGSMARTPEGPWAEWLIDMVEKRENPQQGLKRQF